MSPGKSSRLGNKNKFGCRPVLFGIFGRGRNLRLGKVVSSSSTRLFSRH